MLADPNQFWRAEDSVEEWPTALVLAALTNTIAAKVFLSIKFSRWSMVEVGKKNYYLL